MARLTKEDIYGLPVSAKEYDGSILEVGRQDKNLRRRVARQLQKTNWQAVKDFVMSAHAAQFYRMGGRPDVYYDEIERMKV